MFRKKKQPKIKQIAMAASGDLVFTIGLGKDGKCYSWDATNRCWKPYMIQQEATNAS